MKFKGHKIGGVTYLVNDAEIEKAGSLEAAAKAAKALIEARKEAEKLRWLKELKQRKLKKFLSNPKRIPKMFNNKN